MNKPIYAKDSFDDYLKSTVLINSESREVSGLASGLGLSQTDEIGSIKTAYEYVRDKIPHSFDIKASRVACSASDVINLGHGICYAKAHLLAALLRSVGIPAGICYQRLCHEAPQKSTPEPPNTKLVLHAVNAVFVKSLNQWIRLDARGNTNGISAQFSLEEEQLAFKIHPALDEEDGFAVYSDTPCVVADALSGNKTSEQLKKNLPSYLPDDEPVLFTTKRPGVVMEKGKGMYLWDTEGNRYLDFIGGWAVNCLGHSPDVISEALSRQAATLVNCSPSFYNVPMLKLAGLLTQISCFDRVFFGSSGAEANESAIKLARKYGSKKLSGAYEIITTVNGFHGRTLATMSATGKKQWESLFAPKIPGFVHVPFNNAAAVRDAITPNTCAVMLEPVQGEGGVNIADESYIKELRKLCDENKILLIFDEIQTGIGRTGKLFAYEHYGVEPDIMTLAKGIGGGFPLSAMLTKKQFDIFEPGDQGGSYSSQPLAMSVGFAVVSRVLEAGLPANAEKMGNYLIEALKSIKGKYNLSNIRGKGLLAAFDLPLPVASETVSECLSNGLIINAPQPSTIRLMPPLITEKSHIDEMISILSKVLDNI